MDKQRQNDQLKPIYNSSVLIQVVALKTYRERWMIETGGERGSGFSVLTAPHDDDGSIALFSDYSHGPWKRVELHNRHNALGNAFVIIRVNDEFFCLILGFPEHQTPHLNIV